MYVIMYIEIHFLYLSVYKKHSHTFLDLRCVDPKCVTSHSIPFPSCDHSSLRTLNGKGITWRYNELKKVLLVCTKPCIG